jgi:hypothetical protein
LDENQGLCIERSKSILYMKTPLTVIMLLAGAVSGYSRGDIDFEAGGPSSTLKQVIYGASAANTEVSVTYNGYTVLEQQGATAAAPENPTGTTVYSGTLLTGVDFEGELLGVAGLASTYSQLSPLLAPGGASTILTFYTGGLPAGTLKGSAIAQVPGTATTGTPEATIAIAAWAVNSGGALGAATTLAEAQADTATGDVGYAWGISELQTIATATDPNPPAFMPLDSFSFSLGVSPVPDQFSTAIALGIISTSTLLFRRRK